MWIRLLWIWVLAFAAAYGQIQIKGCGDAASSEAVFYYEDAEGKLEWQEANAQKFILYPNERVNFGFTSSVYWFKICLHRDIRPLPSWLSITYPLLEQIDVYLLDAEGKLIESKHLGTSVRHLEYPLRNFIADLPLSGESEKTLLIRVKTQSSMQVPMTISSTEELLRSIETENLRVGLYYGIFFIIFLYNAVFFVYTKDPNYLRYIFFLTSFILWQLSFDGIGREYLWPDSQWFIHHTSATFIAFTAFSALFFSRHFLSTAHYLPTVDRLIGVMMGLSFILGLIGLFVPYASIIVYLTTLVSIVPVVLFGVGIAVMKRGYRPARFYVMGWSSFLVGTIIFAFNKFNFIPSFYGVNHVQQIGSAVEMIFLSWALADRVHLLQREYIEKLNHLNETLSENVRDALAEARAKDRLFVEQSRLAAMGEMIEQIAHQWRQPLNNLALINQDLYVRYKLGKCDEDSFEKAHSQTDEHLQYLSKTIDDFRNYYKKDKTKQSEDIGEIVNDALRLSDAFLKYAKIKTTVRIDTSKKVVLAKNEMIQVMMNLLKNAHDAIRERDIPQGKIEIGVSDCDEGVQITIEDNAGGISEEVMEHIFDIYFTTKSPETGSGLGLHMSKYIVEESIGGKIRVENSAHGARFVMILPVETA